MFEFSKCDKCQNEFVNEIYEAEYNALGREYRLIPDSWVHRFLCMNCFMDYGNNQQYSLRKFKKWIFQTQNF